jgi:hypothetical protein
MTTIFCNECEELHARDDPRCPIVQERSRPPRRIPFTTADLDRLEAINLQLVDGYAGAAGVQLGEFLDELQQRGFVDG